MEDILRRTLERIEGLEVKHVMNVTDVGHLVSDEDEGEDKIEKSSREIGKSAWDIAKEFEGIFFQDLERLHIEKPTVTPRATEHISEQIELIKVLEEKGFTYRISDGIYFDTSKFPSYGRLSGQPLNEKQEGARVVVNQEKKNPADFALWKFSEPTQPRNHATTPLPKRQMEWESPWGIGFPGWHLECSAMSRKELGQPFDIHCGGVDHIPVHHENEIAQSEAAYGAPFVKHWMHVEFLMVDGQKMSKSLGNVFTLDDVRARGVDLMAFRLFLLGAQYRSKQNFTWEAVDGAQNAYERLCRAIRTWEKPSGDGIASIEERFCHAMTKDLNTPEALSVLWELIDADFATQDKATSLIFIDHLLGLGLAELIGKSIEIPAEMREIADRRWQARKNGDWDESDKLREELTGNGWKVLDGKDGYTLERL
jgi:cysteinyl-tRNA synthetase